MKKAKVKSANPAYSTLALQWPGKQRAVEVARAPGRSKLQPCPQSSIAWDTTGNRFIEGDNLDALKLLK